MKEHLQNEGQFSKIYERRKVGKKINILLQNAFL